MLPLHSEAQAPNSTTTLFTWQVQGILSSQQRILGSALLQPETTDPSCLHMLPVVQVQGILNSQQVILGKEGQPIDLETYGDQLLNSCEQAVGQSSGWVDRQGRVWWSEGVGSGGPAH